MNPTPRILVFDIFGTVVDWHGSIVREVGRRFPAVNADAFALAWRAGYQPAMEGVRSGGRDWVKLDALHRDILDSLLPRFGLDGLSDADRVDLNRVWYRLDPWPDSVAGLTRLKARFTICSLSNGNLGLLTDMAKRAGLPWDCVLSAEVFRAYKPDPRVYLGAAEVFDLAPAEVMMVAAHHDDLAAARANGLQTAYIERPLEFGAGQPKDVSPDPANTLHARDLLHMANQLGC
ncbi:haloacid dehalogenase type II [Hydrogenophaga sp. A37]|uniref:haloacid dehalogenase type II n=1 Tax=Hydrogenophaga sp. A37 TaxID=1945864 RepID=UPI000985001F|nr:haloacid dehalogenase type II [Hydrogenophaga sp. A37]OOG87846.1 haloacid dehalogenase, type II [Hydrogenophaga sp. A37]